MHLCAVSKNVVLIWLHQLVVFELSSAHISLEPIIDQSFPKISL